MVLNLVDIHQNFIKNCNIVFDNHEVNYIDVISISVITYMHDND